MTSWSHAARRGRCRRLVSARGAASARSSGAGGRSISIATWTAPSRPAFVGPRALRDRALERATEVSRTRRSCAPGRRSVASRSPKRSFVTPVARHSRRPIGRALRRTRPALHRASSRGAWRARRCLTTCAASLIAYADIKACCTVTPIFRREGNDRRDGGGGGRQGVELPRDLRSLESAFYLAASRAMR